MSPVTIAWTRRASRPSTKRSSCRRSAAGSAAGRAIAQVEACSLKVLDASWRESGKGADPRKMADPGESAGAVVQAPVGSDARAVQLHGQSDERGIVEGEAELAPQTGGALQKRCSGRGHDEGERLQVVHGVVEPRRAQAGLEEEHVPDFVQEEGRDVHLARPGLHLREERARLFYKILITGLEPFDEDGRVNDDLRGRSASRDSSGRYPWSSTGRPTAAPAP